MECYGLKSRHGLSKTNLKQEGLSRPQNRCYVLRFRQAKSSTKTVRSTSHAQREARVTRVAPSSLASPSNVLRGSSSVPFPLVSGAGTRYEPLRTSAGEATSSCACLARLGDSEFALCKSSSFLFHLIEFIKCWRIFL